MTGWAPVGEHKGQAAGGEGELELPSSEPSPETLRRLSHLSVSSRADAPMGVH